MTQSLARCLGPRNTHPSQPTPHPRLLTFPSILTPFFDPLTPLTFPSAVSPLFNPHPERTLPVMASTFYFIRCQKNPSFYGLPAGLTDGGLYGHMQNTCLNGLKQAREALASIIRATMQIVPRSEREGSRL